MGAMTDKLASGESLYPGQFLISANGAYMLLLTQRGLSLYDITGGGKRLYWGGEGPQHDIQRLTMQADGNLVAVKNPGVGIDWETRTQELGKGGDNYGFHNQQGAGNYLRLQPDGNLGIYNKSGGIVWDRLASGGHGGFLNDVADAIGTIGKAAVDLTQSPIWQVIAGAAVFVPGIGVAVSAGMEAAALAGKVIRGKVDVLDAAAQGLSIAGASGIIDAKAVQAGFEAGVGVIVQNPTAESLQMAYSQLSGSPAAQAGFNAAAAVMKGMATGTAPANVQNAEAKAGYYAQLGSEGAPASVQQATAPIVDMSAASRAGALTATQNLRGLTASVAATQAVRALQATTAQATTALAARPAATAVRPLGFFEWLFAEVKAGFHRLTGS